MVAILKFFKWRLLPNRKSDWAKTWLDALELYRDLDLLKWFIPISNMAAILKFFKQHLLPNPKLLDWAKAWWKHQSDIVIQICLNCFVPLSRMAAILKILKPHLLPNPKSDCAETWWEALGPHGDLELWTPFHSDIQDGPYVGNLEYLQMTFFPNCKLDWAETWLEASEQHRDSELLKLCHFGIKAGHHGCHLENLQTTSTPEQQVKLSQNLVGGIRVTWRFKIAKFVLFQYPRWPLFWPSWKSWNDICSQMVSSIKLKLSGRHWGDMEIQNC